MEKLKPYLTVPRIGAWLLLLSLPLFLCACFGKSALPDHREGASRAKLRWERDGVILEAVAEYSAPSTEGERDVSLCFSTPTVLNGARLSRHNGVITLSMGIIEADGSALAPLLAVAELLIWEGSLDYVSFSELCGTRLRYAELCREGKILGLWLDPKDGTPKQVTLNDLTLSVLSFEKIQE